MKAMGAESNVMHFDALAVTKPSLHHTPLFGTKADEKSPSQNKGFFAQSAWVIKTMTRKFTHWQEFKYSFSIGYREGKNDLLQALHSQSRVQLAKRVGLETLGIVVWIACLPFPGPNPGLFISPTGRRFIRGFLFAELKSGDKKNPEDDQSKAA
jgi:hypothetical protein